MKMKRLLVEGFVNPNAKNWSTSPTANPSDMHKDILKREYIKHNNIRSSERTPEQQKRHKELEKEWTRRGNKTRMGQDFWDTYQKVKPKPGVHYKDADGKSHVAY
jgi:hypothetical protein